MFLWKQFPVKQTLSPWYVTGFIEGSGSFTYSRSGDSVVPYFALKVSAGDRALLQELRTFFGGSGRIYDIKVRARGQSEHPDLGAYFRVTRVVDLATVVAHFERHPLAGAKAIVFKTWRDLVAAKRRFRKPDKARILELTRRLSQAAGRGREAES
jgi:hypothetical protein